MIYDKYRDRDFAANAQKEVEEIRRRALLVGGVTTGGAFLLNEFTRLTMRSRKLKYSLLKHLNINLFLLPCSHFQAEGSQRAVLVAGPHRGKQILLRLAGA